MPRLTGKNGRVYLNAEPSGVVQIADIFNWEANFSSTLMNCSIKGDLKDRFVFSHGTGTFTAERYVQTKATMSGLIASEIAVGNRISFELYLVNADATYSKITGQGYITRADISAPHAKAVDRIEVQMDEFVLTDI
jgi:hypothetical protein